MKLRQDMHDEAQQGKHKDGILTWFIYQTDYDSNTSISLDSLHIPNIIFVEKVFPNCLVEKIMFTNLSSTDF